MPTRRGSPYMLGELNTLTDPQLVAILAIVQAKLETLTTIDERLSKLETRLENWNERDINHNECNGERGPLIQYEERNVRDLDDQYLKSIKLNVLTFYSRLDPQFFLEWLWYMDKYFTWYPVTEARKVKFTVMKLIDQAIANTGSTWNQWEHPDVKNR